MKRNLSVLVLTLLLAALAVVLFKSDFRLYLAEQNRYVFIINGLWHFLAAYYFLFFSRGMIARYTSERPVSISAQMLMQFLGGINSAISLLAFLVIFSDIQPQKPLFLFFAAANFSQFVLDCVAHQKKYANWRLLEITIVDGLVAALNLAYFLHS